MPPQGNTAPDHDSYAALRFRDFRFLLLGKFLAGLGDQMVTVAIGWEIYERTRKPIYLGYLGLAEVLPVILLSLPAGHLSDVYNRRTIALVMKAILALLSLGLAAISYTQGPIALIYLCIVGIGTARAFYSPASSTLLPQTVPPELYSNAATWGSNGWQLSAAIGPALGGAVIALSKRAMPVYLFDTLFSLAFVVFISQIRGKQGERAKGAANVQTLLEGLRFLRENQLILSTITLDLFAVLLGGAVTLLPVFARDILKVGPIGLGWMRAAPAIGAVLTALAIAHRPPFRQAGKVLLVAVAGFGIATVVFGVSRSFPLSMAMLFLLGAFDNISVVVRSTLLLVRVPDEMRGRISAVNNIFVGASNELGGFESGVTAAWFGPVNAVIVGGIGTVLVVLGIAAIWPELRNLKALQPDSTETIDLV